MSQAFFYALPSIIGHEKTFANTAKVSQLATSNMLYIGLTVKPI